MVRSTSALAFPKKDLIGKVKSIAPWSMYLETSNCTSAIIFTIRLLPTEVPRFPVLKWMHDLETSRSLMLAVFFCRLPSSILYKVVFLSKIKLIGTEPDIGRIKS